MMQAYLAGELSPRMQHEVEKYLLDHPFEAEAMEGYAENTKTFRDLSSLDKQLKERIGEKKEQHRKVVPLWRQFLPYAASFILVLVATITAVYFYGGAGSNNPISLDEPDVIQLDSLQSNQLVLPSSRNTKISASTKKDIASNSPTEETELALKFTDEETNSDKPSKQTSANSNQISSGGKEAVPIIAQSKAEREAITQPSVKPISDTLDDHFEEMAMQEEEAVKVSGGAKAKKEMRSSLIENEPEEMEGQTIERISSTQKTNSQLEGIVEDAETGEALPGVNVMIKHSNIGVNTDLDGHFTINTNDGDILVVSFIGMKSKEIVISGNKFLEITLSTDVNQLSEVVVTGYGTAEEAPNTYQSARPKGGMKAYKQYLETELSYPESAIEKGLEGTVKLKVTISPTGRIKAVEVVKGLSVACDAEAIRLIEKGPSWKAAEKNREGVESTVRVKIKFKLPEK